MVDEDTYCIEVLTQVSAATKGLQQVALGLFDDYLRHGFAVAAPSAARSRSQADRGDRRRRAAAQVLRRRREDRRTNTFDEAGAIEIGCHQAGHYATGMKIAVEIS